MFSNLALGFAVCQMFTEDEPWQAGVTQALQEKLGIHEADPDIPDIPDFQLATRLHTEKNDESTKRTGHATRRIAHQRGGLCARMDSDRQI